MRARTESLRAGGPSSFKRSQDITERAAHVFALRAVSASDAGRTVVLAPDAERGGTSANAEKLLGMDVPYATMSANPDQTITVAFHHGDDWVDSTFCE